jgi:hypothetical protein
MRKKSLRSLINAARKAYEPAPTHLDEPAPLGFATQVAREWAGPRESIKWADLFERFGWWGAAASAAICLMAFVHGKNLSEPNPFDVLLEAESGSERLY